MPPFTILQLTDCHLGARWGRDPAETLAAVLDQVHRTLPGPPDAVLVTGDIANTPTDAEYARARELLADLDVPAHVLPGNHDDRAQLSRHFSLPDTGRADLSDAVDLGPVRLVALDTTRPGADGGQLDAPRLEWLEATLAVDPATPTLLAMHHPPLLTGLPAMDAIGIPAAERAALEACVARHRQVQLIVAGHVHRVIAGMLGATPVLAVPGTNLQVALDLAATDIRIVDEPPCFALHVLVDGRLVSHVAPVVSIRT